MSTKRTRRLRWTFVVTVLVAMVPFLWGWAHLLDSRLWNTGARMVSWRDGEGERLLEPDWRGCSGDIRLSTLVVGQALWATTQPSNRFPGGALAKIEPQHRRGTVAWPLPADKPLLWTRGLRAHGSGSRIALVYQTEAEDGSQLLALTVAGPEGLDTPVTHLPGSAFSQILSVDFVGTDAEVVLVPATAQEPPGDAAPMVVSFGGGAPRSRSVPRSALCLAARACHIFGAVAGEKGYRFFVSRGKDLDQIYLVDERGAGQLVAGRGGQLSRHDMDRTALGILRNTERIAQLSLSSAGEVTFDRTDDGQLTPLPGSYRSDGPALYWEKKVRQDHAVTQYFEQTPRLATFLESRGDRAALWVEERASEQQRRWLIAATDRQVASDLSEGALLARPGQDGGFYLLTKRGHFLELDSALRRADPLGLIESVRQEGTIDLGLPTFWHPLLFAWVLFGLFGSLAFALLSVLVVGSKEPEKRKIALGRRCILAVALYVACCVPCILELWPLFVASW